jgi:hypothetical protein
MSVRALTEDQYRGRQTLGTYAAAVAVLCALVGGLLSAAAQAPAARPPRGAAAVPDDLAAFRRAAAECARVAGLIEADERAGRGLRGHIGSAEAAGRAFSAAAAAFSARFDLPTKAEYRVPPGGRK